MNILLVSEVYLPTISGVASSTDSIARFLANRGHVVYVICPRPIVPFETPIVSGIHFIFTPSIRDPFFVNKPMTIIPFGFWEIWQTIKTHDVDIVHVQEPGALGLMSIFLASIYKLPMIGAAHFSLEQFASLVPLRPISVFLMKQYMRIVYPHYRAIMVPTKTAAHDLAILIGHPEKIFPISNGVDTFMYKPNPSHKGILRKKYHIDSDKVVFLYVGRLDGDKNIETILRALSHTKNIDLIIAGTGKQEQALKQMAESFMLNNRVTWFDQISLQSMIELYQLADGFVIMSPIETQSIVTLQAVASGLPIIAARAGALPELVLNGVNGYLVNTYDDNKLAEKMMYLFKRSDLRTRMGKESRRISLPHHKPTALKELEELYQEVLGV